MSVKVYMFSETVLDARHPLCLIAVDVQFVGTIKPFYKMIPTNKIRVAAARKEESAMFSQASQALTCKRLSPGAQNCL